MGDASDHPPRPDRDEPTENTQNRGKDTLNVPELAALIGERLRNVFTGDLWVRGTIRDLTRARSGHVYFSLTDGDGADQARLPVMLHSRDKVRVNRLLVRSGGSVRMTDGTEVRIRVRVDFYEPRGQLQLRMKSIDPAFTLGQLAVARAELLARLGAEGILDANRALPMPPLPLRVWLVTAASSDAAADVLDELDRSGFAFAVTVVDVPVQGLGSPEAIAATLDALAEVDEEADVVVLARGGGSATDLAAFDHELIARAIARQPTPVITGIGHEMDRSVADEVASISAKTPTAAAGVLVELVRAAWDRAELAHHTIASTARARLDAAAARLGDHRARVTRAAAVSTRGERRRIDALAQRTTTSAQRSLDRERRRVATQSERLPRVATRALDHHRLRFASLAARLDAVDPARALARGWSMTRRADGTLVRSPADVTDGEVVTTTLAGGTLVSVVRADDGTAPDTTDRSESTP